MAALAGIPFLEVGFVIRHKEIRHSSNCSVQMFCVVCVCVSKPDEGIGSLEARTLGS